MTSAIDPSKPVFGNPTTASVRNNFQHAKDEIEQLQAGRILRVASVSESVEIFQQCAVNDVGQVVEFNQVALDTTGGQFEFDSLNNAITIAEPSAYSWHTNIQIIRKIGTSDLDWSLWIQTLVPGGSWTNFAGSRKIVTLPADLANAKLPVSFGNDIKITVAGTKIRFMQACTNVTKQVGIVSIPPSGSYPSSSGIILNLHALGKGV